MRLTMRSRFMTFGVLTAASVAVAACSMTPGRYSSWTTTDSDLLTRRELSTVAGGTGNAYSALERLRPLFLATPSGSGALNGGPQKARVFINGAFAGDVDVLKTIPLANVESIQRVRATAAFTTYGERRAVLLVRIRWRAD